MAKIAKALEILRAKRQFGIFLAGLDMMHHGRLPGLARPPHGNLPKAFLAKIAIPFQDLQPKLFPGCRIIKRISPLFESRHACLPSPPKYEKKEAGERYQLLLLREDRGFPQAGAIGPFSSRYYFSMFPPTCHRHVLSRRDDTNYSNKTCFRPHTLQQCTRHPQSNFYLRAHNIHKGKSQPQHTVKKILFLP